MRMGIVPEGMLRCSYSDRWLRACRDSPIYPNEREAICEVTPCVQGLYVSRFFCASRMDACTFRSRY